MQTPESTYRACKVQRPLLSTPHCAVPPGCDCLFRQPQETATLQLCRRTRSVASRGISPSAIEMLHQSTHDHGPSGSKVTCHNVLDVGSDLQFIFWRVFGEGNLFTWAWRRESGVVTTQRSGCARSSTGTTGYGCASFLCHRPTFEFSSFVTMRGTGL
nr:hypothetical protein CFP56_08133 [Quercus suber]